MSFGKRLTVVSTLIALLCAGTTVCAGAAGKALAGQPVDESEAPLDRFNTLYGPVGLLTVPTAYATPRNKVLFSTAIGRDLKSVSGNYGITAGVEVGGAFLDRDAASNRTLGNAKINIVPKNFRFFGIGIGVIDVADTFNQTFYFVASANWTVPGFLEERAIGFRLHGGVGTGLFKDDPIGGAEVIFDRHFSAVREWNARNVNAAFRYVHDQASGCKWAFRAKWGS